MLLKVSNGNGDWALFDNVDQVNFGASKGPVLKREDLEGCTEEGMVNLISKDCFPRDKPLDIGLLEFYRNGTKVTALFATVAYVLNNAGDTIEKISAFNRRNKINGE